MLSENKIARSLVALYISFMDVINNSGPRMEALAIWGVFG